MSPHSSPRPMLGSEDRDEFRAQMLVPQGVVGAVIGKGGATIKQTAATAGCRVSMSTRGEGERRVIMSGNYESCVVAQSIVQQQIVESAQAQLLDIGDCTVIVLVRHDCAGAVIGKAGANLNDIRNSTGVKVKMQSKDEAAHVDDGFRDCTLTGDFQQVLQAERVIADILIAARNGGQQQLQQSPHKLPVGGPVPLPQPLGDWEEPSMKRPRVDMMHQMREDSLHMFDDGMHQPSEGPRYLH